MHTAWNLITTIYDFKINFCQISKSSWLIDNNWVSLSHSVFFCVNKSKIKTY